MEDLQNWKIFEATRLSRVTSSNFKKVTALMGTDAVPLLATLLPLLYNKFLNMLILILYQTEVSQCCGKELNLTKFHSELTHKILL